MTEDERRQQHEQNRRSWNAATIAHNSHKGDQGAYLGSGGSTLFPEEIALLGDVRGKDVLHLLCNSGQDTLSIAPSGAHVTGVDISDEAIRTAETLSDASGIAATFRRADIFVWLSEAAEAGTVYDIAFISYGAICWISDIDDLMKKTVQVLKPGGRLVVMEFHPVLDTLNPDGSLRATRFSGRSPTPDDGVGDYIFFSPEGLVPWGYEKGVEKFVNPEDCWLYYWNMGEILGAVLGAGLRIAHYEEFDYANGYCLFIEPTDKGARRYGTPHGVPDLPLMYGLIGEKA